MQAREGVVCSAHSSSGHGGADAAIDLVASARGRGVSLLLAAAARVPSRQARFRRSGRETMCTIMAHAAAMVVGLTLAASTAEDRAGRFTMNPVEGGMMRLDTQTGAVSICRRKEAQWVCEAVGEESRSARQEQDIERPTVENKELKAEIQRLEELLLGDPKKGEERRGGRFGLPSGEDLNRAFAYFERLY